MGGCVAIAAYNRRSWKSESLLGPNDMDNPLALVSQTKVGEIECFDIFF